MMFVVKNPGFRKGSEGRSGFQYSETRSLELPKERSSPPRELVPKSLHRRVTLPGPLVKVLYLRTRYGSYMT